MSRDKLHFVKSSKKFFLPVKVLSRKFRGKFLSLLKEAYYDRAMHFPDSEADISEEVNFKDFLDRFYGMEWVVYCKKPFKDVGHVIRYLGRYTYRVAISDHRIVDFDAAGGQVSFKFKDYKDQNKIKVMTLSALEFMRRFFLHVLPKGFMKIRNYGILGNRDRNYRLALCFKLLNKYLSTQSFKEPKPGSNQRMNCCPVLELFSSYPTKYFQSSCLATGP